MPECLSIPQELAAELGLPEAQGAPRARVFSVARLLEWQEVRMREIEARRKQRALSCFLPPAGARGYGVVRRIDD